MTPEAWATVAGGVVVVGGVLVTMARFVWRFLRLVGRFLDSWFGHDGEKSMPERMGELEERVGAIEEQWTPNGGGSALDALSRVETMVKGIAAQSGHASESEPPESP